MSLPRLPRPLPPARRSARAPTPRRPLPDPLTSPPPRTRGSANADMFFIVINAPMDIFLLTTSGASVVLYLSLQQLYTKPPTALPTHRMRPARPCRP